MIESLSAKLAPRSYLEDKKNHQRYYIRKVLCFRNTYGWVLQSTRTAGVKIY